MDPVTIAIIGIVAYVLLKQSSTGQTALTTALQKPTAPATSAAKPSAGSGGGGAPSGSSAAAQAAHAAVQAGSTYTDPAVINSLATDGNSSDAQVAAYLAALNNNDTTLANAIIGDVAPVDTQSDPNSYAGYIAPVAAPATPTFTYDGSTDPNSTDALDAGSSDSTDYGDSGYEES